MITLLVDANLDGHASLIASRLGAEPWREFQEQLQITFLHFDQTALRRDAPDQEVWRFCQHNHYYLLTANRNLDSADSLEATIRSEGTAFTLPVFTLADAQRALVSPNYLDQVIERLILYALDSNTLAGSGRLYLP